jgi:hypothetical protein
MARASEINFMAVLTRFRLAVRDGFWHKARATTRHRKRGY